MKNKLTARVILLFALFMLITPVRVISADQPVVHAILFYSPTCPHCYQVITEDLPPILEHYGEQVVIVGVNTYTEEGNQLFVATLEKFDIPQEIAGVPLLVIGETVLIGSVDIPQKLPELIESGLASGGIDWPAIPGLEPLLNEEAVSEPAKGNTGESVSEETAVAENQESESGTELPAEEEKEAAVTQDEQVSNVPGQIGGSITELENMTVKDRFMQDKTGNSISTVILAGMIFSIVVSGVVVLRPLEFLKPWPNLVVVLLMVVGIGVASYMAYVEVTQSEAVCGPVGDCNTVQQSPYATLFGVIPIGLLGVVGYLVIGLAWFISLSANWKWRRAGLLCLWGLSLFGTLFSIYLTFLEPFVIGASCVWCLTSAVVMTLLFWNSTARIKEAGGLRQLTKF
jgi:uncharacterized membrane protein/thiol-disulfide isomerase/thioredoxin